MPDSPLRWGIVSAGRISNDFCIGLRSDPEKGHLISAVAARDLKRAEEFAKLHGIQRAYGNYDDIIQDPGIDIYYVGNINTEHFNIVMLLLNNRKNVLCEKPLGMNVKETQAMISLAKERGVFFMEGMWARFFPVQVKLREELKNKTLGDVKLVHVTFGVVADKSSDRVTKLELGGGTTMDMGVYTIALSQMVFGEMPTKITAVGFLNESGVDVLDSVTLEYSDNRLSQFQTTCLTQVPNEANICGTKGVIKIKKPFWCSDSIEIKDKLNHFQLPEPAGKSFYDNGVGFLYEANEIKKCLSKGLKECPIVTHKDTMEFATIIEACRKMMGVKYPQDSI